MAELITDPASGNSADNSTGNSADNSAVSSTSLSLPELLEKRYEGFTGYCGIHFDEVTDDHGVVSCALKPELLNPMGIAHGGLVATLMDVSAGLMALQADHWLRNIVTQSCDIHYLRPGTGSRLRAESTVIRKGKRVCVLRAECFTDDNRCTAYAVYEIAYLG